MAILQLQCIENFDENRRLRLATPWRQQGMLLKMGPYLSKSYIGDRI